MFGWYIVPSIVECCDSNELYRYENLWLAFENHLWLVRCISVFGNRWVWLFEHKWMFRSGNGCSIIGDMEPNSILLSQHYAAIFSCDLGLMMNWMVWRIAVNPFWIVWSNLTVENLLQDLYSMVLNHCAYWHRSGSTLAHLMVCCLTALSHYQNQYWLIICQV